MSNKIRGWKQNVGLMWLGGYLTLIKNTITMFAVIWFYTQSTGSATVLAFISAFKSIPLVLIAPFGGVLADRFPRKRVFITANLGISGLSIIMGILFCFGVMKVPFMYALVFLTESFASLIIPTMQASIPVMAPKGRIPKLVGLMTAFVGMYGIIGQIGGTLLTKFFKIDVIMFINAGIALAALIPLLFVVIPQPKRVISEEIEKTNVLGDFIFGIKYVAKWRSLLLLILFGFAGSFFLSPPTSLLPILISRQGGKVELYATATVILMVAYFACALLLGVFGGIRKKSVMMFIALICAASGTILMIVPALPLMVRVFAGCALLGCSISLYNVPFYSILSSEVEKEVQGRVISVASALLTASTPAGLFVAGPCSDAIGVGSVFIICAAMLVLLGVIILIALRNMETQKTGKQTDSISAVASE